MAKLFLYRLWCNNATQWEFVWSESTTAPVLCPMDPIGHTVDPNKTTIERTLQTESLHTSSGLLRVAFEKPEGSRMTRVSHDWTDRTTWRERSIRAVDEIAVDSGDQITWNLVNQHVIDCIHGKQWNEDSAMDSNGDTYNVTVKVNDAVKVIQDPHFGAGGDFTVGYDNGDIVFTSALNPGDIVKVTYHHADLSTKGSCFSVKPEDGKQFILESVDVQFSLNVGLTDTAVFDILGYAAAFAPSMLIENGGTLNPTDKIVIASTKYKSMRDYQAECDRAYPSYPVMGGAGWRGLSQEIVVFHWEYLRGIPFKSSVGMELLIYLEHDEPFTGEYASVTLYAASETEVSMMA